MIPPLVLVVWEDAGQLDVDTWVQASVQHSYEPIIFRQVGFLLSDDPGGIVLTSCWGVDLIGPREQIPRGMILEMTPLCKRGPSYKRSKD